MEKIWLRQYPAGVPAFVRTDPWPSLVDLLDDCLRKYRGRPAYRWLGRTIGFGRVDDDSRAMAALLQSLGLARGDRVAVMLPNLPQVPIAVAAILRAGLVVVNVDPRSAPRELQHQLKDSGARAIFVSDDGLPALQQVFHAVPTRRVILAGAGDLLGPVHGRLVNHLAGRAQRRAPRGALQGALRWTQALARGRRLTLRPPSLGPDDIALLQYTGGTTGVSKGAVLLHRQLVANLLQSEAWNRPALARIPPAEQPVMLCALPLHHIFGFSLVMLLGLLTGCCGLMVADARDTGALLRSLARHRVHLLPAMGPQFDALLQHPQVDRVDWSSLVLCVSGGMAVQPATARRWHEKTGCLICEGYGLTEASPSVTCNPVDATVFSGSIGVPLPGTDVRLIDDAGAEVPAGSAGEIAVRGPQVMAGYWQRPDDTARAITADGWLRSGDIGVMDERGHLRLVDRKRDMILVSGFPVCPNEIEEVVGLLPGVLECAAVAMPDARAGEAVKLVVVKTDPAARHPSEADIRAHCETHLTGYKRPRRVEFSAALPRTKLGKVLRRELRETV